MPNIAKLRGARLRNITIAGGNLFRLAATELGDATQWIRIAQLNGLNDPILNGLITLNIPDRNLALTGGIPLTS